jgi:hypothetical protein
VNDYRNPMCEHETPWYTTCYPCAAKEQQAAQAYSVKPSNPKDAIATDKAPLHLVPAAFKAYTAMALAEGAMKYGAHNWRAAGVRASVYKSALDRHLDKWWNGEDCDPATGVPHLANACACLAILIDARVSEKLTDDRPPKQKQLGQLLDGAVPTTIAGLRRVFGSADPKHWTIDDELQADEG